MKRENEVSPQIAVNRREVLKRAVALGGAGTAVVRQEFLGSNTTTLTGIGPAPNFRFKFRLWIPPV